MSEWVSDWISLKWCRWNCLYIAPHKSNRNNGVLACEVDENGYFVEFVNDNIKLEKIGKFQNLMIQHMDQMQWERHVPAASTIDI